MARRGVKKKRFTVIGVATRKGLDVSALDCHTVTRARLDTRNCFFLHNMNR